MLICPRAVAAKFQTWCSSTTALALSGLQQYNRTCWHVGNAPVPILAEYNEPFEVVCDVCSGGFPAVTLHSGRPVAFDGKKQLSKLPCVLYGSYIYMLWFHKSVQQRNSMGNSDLPRRSVSDIRRLSFRCDPAVPSGRKED